MKKKTIGVLILGLSLGFTGCRDKVGSRKDVKDEIPQQFEVLSQEQPADDYYFDLTIVRHKETGKRFIIYREGRKGGICPLD